MAKVTIKGDDQWHNTYTMLLAEKKFEALFGTEGNTARMRSTAGLLVCKGLHFVQPKPILINKHIV